MQSMKLSDDEKKKMVPGPMISGNGPDYPYGLSIHLEESSLKKLGVKDLPEIGQTINLDAQAKVVSVSEYKSEDAGIRRSVDLQITHLDMENGTGTSDDEKISKLYGINEPIGKPLVKG